MIYLNSSIMNLTQNNLAKPYYKWGLLWIVVLFCSSVSAQYANQLQKITACDRFQNEQFGYSTSLSENYMIVGSVDEGTLSQSGASSEGAAYIFKRSTNNEWVEIQKIVANDRKEDDHYGGSVAISDNYAFVGSSGQDFDSQSSNKMTFAGAVYVYKRHANGQWIQQQKLVPADRERNASFGNSITISDKYLIIGAANESTDPSNTQSFPSSGAVYIYEKDSNGNWYETQKLIASDRATSAYFGHCMSISGDRIAVGAYWAKTDANNENSLKTAGAVYIYDKNAEGYWEETQKIVPNDRAKYDFFGFSVAIDGDNLLVGSYRKWKNGDGIVGAAYLYKLDDNGNWIETQKLEASDGGKLDSFGRTVALNGNIAIVGASGDYDDKNGNNPLLEAGSVYVFTTDDCKNWRQVQKFTANVRGYSAGFGSNLSLYGNHLLIGAPDESRDTNHANELHDAGAVYLFELTNIGVLPCNENTTETNPPIEIEDVTINIGVTISIENCSIILTTNEANGQYQWIDCNTGIELQNEGANRTYKPTSNGTYAVIITKNDTTIISDCYTIKVVDQPSEQESTPVTFKVTPNPNTGVFKIIVNGTMTNDYPVEIVNSFGMSIKKLTLIQSVTQVDLGRVNKGLYIVKIKTAEGMKRFPIYVE